MIWEGRGAGAKDSMSLATSMWSWNYYVQTRTTTRSSMRCIDRYADKEVETTKVDSRSWCDTKVLRISIVRSHQRGPVVATGKKWPLRIDVLEMEEKARRITLLGQEGQRTKLKYTTMWRRWILGTITRFTLVCWKMKRRITSMWGEEGRNEQDGGQEMMKHKLFSGRQWWMKKGKDRRKNGNDTEEH